MLLWNKVCKTDPKHIKEVKKGSYKFHAIDAQHQIQLATEMWGPMGSDWGVVHEEFDMKEGFVLYTARLYYDKVDDNEHPDSIPIHSDISLTVRKQDYHTKEYYNAYNEDWSKKVATDALTKGLSKLGFNADVFLGAFDSNKCANQPEPSYEHQTTSTRSAVGFDSRPNTCTERQRKMLWAKFKSSGKPEDHFRTFLEKTFNITSTHDVPFDGVDKVVEWIEGTERRAAPINDDSDIPFVGIIKKERVKK